MQVCSSRQPVFYSHIPVFSGNQSAQFNMTSASPSPTIPLNFMHDSIQKFCFSFIKLMVCAYKGSFHDVLAWSNHGTYLLTFSGLPVKNFLPMSQVSTGNRSPSPSNVSNQTLLNSNVRFLCLIVSLKLDQHNETNWIGFQNMISIVLLKDKSIFSTFWH